ncbi:cyclophilin-like fold protein [Vibrio natriegens]|uniref:cyclophilin-like fold protein n=1 Tax=Vibrio natriegens TaxID=691 RepID=UPI003B58E343
MCPLGFQAIYCSFISKHWQCLPTLIIAQLPLTLELEDYASTEKIAYLSSKLTKEGAPAGVSSKAGDISYYAPWGNLVVFYKNFGYASGLINLGKVDGDLSRFTSGGSMKVTIEVIE